MWITGLVIGMIAVILWDWYAIRNEKIKHRYISKPLSVALIIVVFLTQVNTLEFPSWIFLTGLLLGLCGDILLLFYKDTWFILGLSSFLLGHVAYMIGFFFTGIIDPIWGAIVMLVPVITIIYMILKSLLPHTEKAMKKAVFAYGIVISMMLYSALCLMFKAAWEPTATILAIAGAGLFVTSDVFLARWKFLGTNTEFWPMVTYHLAQIAIASAIVIQVR